MSEYLEDLNLEGVTHVLCTYAVEPSYFTKGKLYEVVKDGGNLGIINNKGTFQDYTGSRFAVANEPVKPAEVKAALKTTVKRTKPLYLSEVVVSTNNELKESLHIETFMCDGELVANVSLNHDGMRSHAMIAVPLDSLEEAIKKAKRV